jgi:hypothetical protein
MPASPVNVTAYFQGITNISPSSGVVTGGYTVMIRGQGLGSKDVTNVALCGVSATILSDNSPTQILVQANAVTGPSIGSVTVSSRSAGAVTNLSSYTYVPLAPTALAGTSITLSSFYAQWSAVSGATNYLMDVSAISDFSSFITGYSNLAVQTMTNYPVTGLSAGLNYYYRMRSQQNGIVSYNSNTNFVNTSIYAIVAGQANPTNAGSVMGVGNLVVGSTNSLTAVASNNWIFISWSDGVADNPRQIVVPANGVVYTANFSSLTVPTLASYGIYTNHFAFTVSGDLNQTVVVETCTNLTEPVWLPLQTNMLGGGSYEFSDPNSPQLSACYYRLRNQ